jgi:hypothetical protein
VLHPHCQKWHRRDFPCKIEKTENLQKWKIIYFSKKKHLFSILMFIFYFSQLHCLTQIEPWLYLGIIVFIVCRFFCIFVYTGRAT